MSHLTIFDHAGTEVILPGYLTSYLVTLDRLVQGHCMATDCFKQSSKAPWSGTLP